MAVTLPNAGKRTNMRHFAALSGQASMFSIEKDASPELYALAKNFPEAVGNALFMLGGYVRKGMRRAVEDGGTNAHTWLGLSDLQQYRRMDRLKRGEFPRKAYKNFSKEGLHARSKDRRSHLGAFGKIAQALAFRKPKNKLMVEIGALSPSAESFFSAVQAGRRGGKGVFQFTGTQIVTPRMRRALWAAGFPVSEKTTVIGQEARPVILPLFQKMSPEFEAYLVRRTVEFLAGKGIDAGVR